MAQEQYTTRYTVLFDSIARSREQLTNTIKTEYGKAKELSSAINSNVSTVYDLEELGKNILEDAARPFNLGNLVTNAFSRIDSAYATIQNLVGIYEQDKDKVTDLLKLLK